MEDTIEGLNEQDLRDAAVIARDYGLPISAVYALILRLRSAGKLPEPHEEALIMRNAEPLRRVLAALYEPAQELHQQTHARFESGRVVMPPRVDLPMLASAVHDLSFDDQSTAALDEVLAAVDLVARTLCWAVPRDTPASPRRALISRMVATAGRFWFDYGEEYPEGEFFNTGDGTSVTPGTGMEFIVRIVSAVAEDATWNELEAAVEHMQDMIGQTAYLEDMADEDPQSDPRHLRLVK